MYCHIALSIVAGFLFVVPRKTKIVAAAETGVGRNGNEDIECS